MSASTPTSTDPDPAGVYATRVLNAAEQYAAAPLPAMFELHRSHDVTGVSGDGLVAAGMIFPLGGGAAYRWCSLQPPPGYPVRVQQASVFDSVAEVLAVHGHQGATSMAVTDPRTGVGADRRRPEAFMVTTHVPTDVVGWGAWFAEDGRAIVYRPPRTALLGIRQPMRHEVWRDAVELFRAESVTWLTSGTGAQLAGVVADRHSAAVRQAAIAEELARRSTVTEQQAHALHGNP
jgi:hypothetical protein